MRTYVVMAVEKVGDCSACLEQDVKVRWHIGSKRWYCEACWPKPLEVIRPARVSPYWSERVPTYAQLLEERDSIYGIRVEDDLDRPGHVGAAASFAVRCPQHGWLADRLSLSAARRRRDAHLAEHQASVIGLPQ